MPVLSSILVVVAMWLAVLLGPQLSPWTWGGCLLALGLAVLAAVPGLWRKDCRSPGWWLGGVGVLVVGWFAVRAWLSPVADYGMMDLLLLGAVIGGFVVMRAMQASAVAERVFLWGLGILLLASTVVLVRQVWEPAFTPGVVERFANPSGFFGHYNYSANFLIGASCLMGGAALFGSRYHRLERAMWGGMAVAGSGAIYFTGSRGGQVGAAVAVAAFVVMALIGGKRRGAGWFAPGVIALPFLGILLVAFLLKGWSRSQEMRNLGTGVEVVMDNTIRLQLIGIAVSCVGKHPWAGGGSRSFSWECNQFWELDTHGPGGSRPEQVHNEILQAAADYGLIGAALLVLLVGTVVVKAVVRAMFGERLPGVSNEDAWRVGGLAGLLGILVQSNFSFVFHLVPGALMLGLCLGRAAHSGGLGEKAAVSRDKLATTVLTLIALGTAGLLVPMGWLGSRVTAVRWADGYAKTHKPPREDRLRALTEAIRRWPLQEFFLDRGLLCQELSAETPPGGGERKELLNRAMTDYETAAKLNPFDPRPVVNRANLLSMMSRDGEAEQAFEQAIKLQGGMEGAFKGGYSKAAHLRLKAERLLAEQKTADALQIFLAARDALEKACVFPSGAPLGSAGRILRIAIAERLGVLLSRAGRDAEAEAEFERAAPILGGTEIRYFYAYHCFLKGRRLWLEERKPAEALSQFLKGRWLNDRTAGILPNGVSTEDQAKLSRELGKNIGFLKGAKVEPSEPPPR